MQSKGVFGSALTGALLLLGCGMVGAAEPDIVEIPLRAKVGDQFTITTTLEQQGRQGGNLVQRYVLTSVDAARVDAVLPTGYRMVWTGHSATGRVILDKTGGAAATIESALQIGKIFRGVPVAVETDASAKPVRMIDWQPTSQKLADAFGSVLTTSLRKTLRNIPEAERESRIKASVDQTIRALIMRHDERSATVLLIPQQLLGNIQHMRWTRGKPAKTNSVGTSFLTEQNPTSLATSQLTRLDESAGIAEVRISHVFDSAKLTEISKAVMRQNARAAASAEPDAGKRAKLLQDVEKQLASLTMSRTDNIRATIDLKSGWVRTFEEKMEVRVRIPGQAPAVNTKKTAIKVEPGMAALEAATTTPTPQTERKAAAPKATAKRATKAKARSPRSDDDASRTLPETRP